MAMYETILLDVLRLSLELLKEEEKRTHQRLNAAAVDFQRDNGDIFAINQCLFLATSLVVRNAANLNATLDYIANIKGLSKDDPTTLLTISTLYYLLNPDDPVSDKELRKSMQIICHRFQKMSWMIGADAMDALGFKKESVDTPVGKND
jgi:hypothetical protein